MSWHETESQCVRNIPGSNHRKRTEKGYLHYSIKTEDGSIVVDVLECEDLPPMDSIGSTSDPYVKFHLWDEPHQVMQTKIVKRNLNPVFNESFRLQCNNLRPTVKKRIEFTIWDWDMGKHDDYIGKVEAVYIVGNYENVWAPIQPKKAEK